MEISPEMVRQFISSIDQASNNPLFKTMPSNLYAAGDGLAGSSIQGACRYVYANFQSRVSKFHSVLGDARTATDRALISFINTSGDIVYSATDTYYGRFNSVNSDDKFVSTDLDTVDRGK